MAERVATVVVGGGLAGLAAARRRVQAGVETILLEKDDRPGGVVRTVRHDGFLLELGPNTVRPTSALLRLVDELGLRPELAISDPALPRYIDFEGRLHPLPTSPGAMLTTRLLSASGKLALLGEPFRKRGRDREESVLQFFERRLGREVAERVVTPFIGGIFAGDPGRLAVADAFPILVQWEKASGSILLGAIGEARRARQTPPAQKARGLLSFREGLESLPRAIARSLGAAFRPRIEVAAVSPTAGGWRVSTSSGEVTGREVILAAPAPNAATLVRSFAPDAAEALAGIPHPAVAVLHLAWPEAALVEPLRGFGHLVVPHADRRILGAVWSSSLFAGRAPEGHALFTVFLGGDRDPEAPSLSDDALVAAAARDLEAAGLVRGQPRLLCATRWQRAIPQYVRGHGARIEVLAGTEARFPGLRFIGNYRGGVSVGDVLRSGAAV